MMEERYHATTQSRFYPDMSNVNKNITVEAKLISRPTYIFMNSTSVDSKGAPNILIGLLVKTHPVTTFIQISHSVSQSGHHGVTVKEASVHSIIIHPIEIQLRYYSYHKISLTVIFTFSLSAI
jgi:hypothetical protein